MKRKRVAAYVMILCTIVMIAGKSVSFANNYENSAFSFNFGSNCYTEVRYKSDTSKLYMQCTGGIATYSAYAQACSAGGTVYKTYWNYGVTMSRGSTKYISSDVYEDGYRNTRILGAVVSAGTASGVWSPDNYNGY